jgi:nucleotide-binding universal stress UspA family protein
MMNAALNQLVSVLATGGTHLGDLCFWSLADATVVRSELESKWKSSGLPHQLLPEPPTVEKAFKLAVRETQVGLAERLIRPVVDDEASVVFAVVHEQKYDAGTLSYTQEAKVVLDLLTGVVSSDAPAHELVAAIASRFAELQDTHTSDDVRRTITRTLGSFAAVLLRENGGVWWVPSPHAQALRKLQATIESIGSSRFYLLPVHDTADAARTLGDAASRSLEADLIELKAEVESFVASPPERTTTLVRRFDAFDALKSRAQLYRDILQVQVKDLDSTLMQLTRSIETLLNAKQAA